MGEEVLGLEGLVWPLVNRLYLPLGLNLCLRASRTLAGLDEVRGQTICNYDQSFILTSFM